MLLDWTTMASLRCLESGDLEAVHGLISRMDVVRHMLLPLCTREDSEKFLRDALLTDQSGAWKSVVRAICGDTDKALFGLCGLIVLKGAKEGEIWYLVDPARWGKGIATAATNELLALGFGELELHRIWATCLPDNPASERVLQKVGMRKEGFLLQNLKIHGVWKDSSLYAMLSNEWHQATSRQL
jgi:RimJ/RimL family protein N-acetyltransferase